VAPNADGEWTRIAALPPDGDGVIEYEDDDIVPSARYGYRLGVPRAGGEDLLGEVWVETPARAILALEGLRPNPASGQLVAAFSLPGPGTARLQLLDVAGRELIAREVGELGRDPTSCRSVSLRCCPPGIYFLRLTRAGRVLNARATVVR